jgi:hypothetical protein
MLPSHIAYTVTEPANAGPVRVKIKIRKQRGWPDKLEVEDFAAPASAVVPLRSAG